ncbi:hypothetical protein HAX54_035498, partial [Datura stramonium]|nr:hypothetical protein [Datura stramonium]
THNTSNILDPNVASLAKIRCCRPGAWVMEEVTSLQVSDDCHSRRHPFDGKVEDRHSVNRPSLVPSGTDSPFLRGDGGQTDRQMSDGPSQWPSLRKRFCAFLHKANGGDDEPSYLRHPVSLAVRWKAAQNLRFLYVSSWVIFVSSHYFNP